MITERMTPVDRAWLLMDRPANPMMIVAVIILNGHLSRAQLRDLVTTHLLAFHRFRCRPVQDTLSASWAPSAAFDVDDHITSVALPSDAAQSELEHLVGELAGTPFNTARPWWSLHLVENYRGGSAIVARFHHCYADGVALVRVLLRMTAGAEATPPPPATHNGGEAPDNPPSLLAPLYSPVAELFSTAVKEGMQLLGQGLSYSINPLQTVDAARSAAAMIGELARLSLLPDDPPTQLKRPLSGARRAAWAPPLPFNEVRTVARILGCTINDVLIATLAGALGRYLETQGERIDGLTLHAAVPVNLRPANEPELSLGNRFGLVFVDLPIGMRHPVERLYAVHAQMQRLKSSPQAWLIFGLLTAVGSLPAAVEDSVIAAFSAKASVVASNLPGPREELRIAGVPIEEMLFWVPQAGSIGTGISILTYNGRVQFGVLADRQVISDPSSLVAKIGAEFERLVLLLLLSPTMLRARPSGSGPTSD